MAAGPLSAAAQPAPGRGPGGLALAFLVALALHLLALAGLALYRLAPPQPPGEQRISIDLAPLMTEAETQAAAETQQAEVAPDEVKPVEDPAELAAAKPPPETAVETPPDTVVQAPVEAVPVEERSPVITSVAPQAEPAAPPPVVEKPKPDLAKLKAEREAKLKAAREAKRREELEEARQDAAEERREALREARAKAAREAKAKADRATRGAAARDSAATSRQNAGGRAAAASDPNAQNQWTAAIRSTILGRMNGAAANGTSGGIAVVRFTVLRSGQVTGAGLARSSGVGQIDSAALSAVRGSLPAAPAGVTQPSLSVTIPLNYRVR